MTEIVSPKVFLRSQAPLTKPDGPLTKMNFQGRRHLDRNAIGEKRLVTPLPNGLHRGLSQTLVAAHEAHTANQAVSTDDSLKDHPRFAALHLVRAPDSWFVPAPAGDCEV